MSEKMGSRFVRGSGNVFADVGLPNAEDALAKAKLAEAIEEAIQRRNLTQTETAAILGVDQPKVSRIVNGRLDGFTQDRLMRYLRVLGEDIEIRVTHRKEGNREGRLTVRIG
jgi:predicted XRE-type DNA-binding protein